MNEPLCKASFADRRPNIVEDTWLLYDEYRRTRQATWEAREGMEYPTPSPRSRPDQHQWWGELVRRSEAEYERLRLRLWFLRAELIDRGTPKSDLPYA